MSLLQGQRWASRLQTLDVRLVYLAVGGLSSLRRNWKDRTMRIKFSLNGVDKWINKIDDFAYSKCLGGIPIPRVGDTVRIEDNLVGDLVGEVQSVDWFFAQDSARNIVRIKLS
jgi:hypothetical protein